MGIDNYLGAEQRPIASANVTTTNLWGGALSPNSAGQGLCNPAKVTRLLMRVSVPAELPLVQERATWDTHLTNVTNSFLISQTTPT